MSDRKIKAVIGLDVQLCWYGVGKNGVTKITANQYSPEPYCTRIYYDIFQEDHVIATVNDTAVAQIIYFPPESGDE